MSRDHRFNESQCRRLRQYTFFQDLSEATLAKLTQGALIQRYPAGTVLFNQGEEPDFLHFLLKGSMEVYGIGPDGREAIVEVFGPVEAHTIAAVVTSTPYLVSGKVVSPALIFMIPAHVFRGMLADDPQLTIKVLAALARQFRTMVRQVKSLKLRTSMERLGCYLLALVDENDGSATFELPYDKRRIASRLGMTPESLSRGSPCLETWAFIDTAIWFASPTLPSCGTIASPTHRWTILNPICRSGHIDFPS